MPLDIVDADGKRQPRRFYFRSPKNEHVFAEHAEAWSELKATFNLGAREAAEAAKAAKKAAKAAAKASASKAPVNVSEQAATVSA
jgi:hypothetical protein